MEWGGGGQWYAWHGSGSVEYHEPPFNAQAFPTRAEADAWVKKEEAETTILEYGVTLVGREEQETALVQVIEDASRRLVNLRREGKQYPNWSD